ncbi:tetratricopeptide repeat protein [Sphingomonas canadensis]|uniref:Tetratricopeptide repeat protein n=1 Tax=Sphingomonas canadensis TaxID=1219257 RepID=A0ABW3H9U7_9SPHN|nr:tetratricopeptide repeat protein [Sphingomonas canadensis]MCW3837943.1 tetratricopeptide repeat protein [Sphingomonas canadensis]
MMLYIGIIALQVACVVHLVKTGRAPLWLTAIIFLPLVGTIAYFIVEILPGMGLNRHARVAREKVEAALDPERELRAARDALDLADTAANHQRVGDALAALGRDAEAIPLYQAAIRKTAGDIDPVMQVKLARSLHLTGASVEALALLQAIPPAAGQSERDRRDLLRAQALEHLGRKEEALELYRDISARMPGEEARCRYAALLLDQGWEGKARKVLEEVENRAKRLDRAQRAADADMYRWASDTLTRLRGQGA